MDKKPEKVRDLLRYNSATRIWEGELAAEFFYIASKVWKYLDFDPQDYLENTLKRVSSMQAKHSSAIHSLNPVRKFVMEICKPVSDSGCFVGFKTETSLDKMLRSVKNRASFYPAYYVYCLRRGLIPLNHKRFTNDLCSVFSELGWVYEKVRSSSGFYIKGVTYN